jgi:hypothetical protein
VRRIALDLRGLTGGDEILRLARGTRPDLAVEHWFVEGPRELRSIAQKWFDLMRQSGNDVLELMHDGCPVACIDEAPFGDVNSFKSHVNVGFFKGAALRDPTGLLQGSGKRMRHVKLRPGLEIDESSLSDLIDAAYLDMRSRLGGKPTSRFRAPMPPVTMG